MCKILQIVFLVGVSCSLGYSQRQFWGTSSQGGSYSNGFIFKTDSIGDNLQIVHHFQMAVDGANISALLYASNEKLYGMAASGGQIGGTNVFAGGTLFEYDLATDQFRVLQHFGATNTALPGTTLPKGEGLPSLTEIAPGVLMGLMQQGGYVFTYNISTGVFTKSFTVPTFQGGAMNTTQQNKINQAFYKAADGNLYATTQTNSACPIANPNLGSIVRLNAAGNNFAIRHRAECLVTQGYMYNGFLAETNGKLYGATLYGGANNKGVIFEYDPTANAYTKRHDFAGSVNNYEPTSLVVGKNGKLYGTSHGGGAPETNSPAGVGSLFEFDLATNTFTKKHDFTLTGQSIYDMGAFPSGLMRSANGKLYGATQYGVFEYNPATDALRVAGRFNSVGFAPSFVQVCRKPAYTAPATTTYTLCKDAAFTIDLASTNAATVVWKHNNITDATRTTPLLAFAAFSEADAGTWECTLTNECGTTVAQTINLQYGEPPAPVVEASGPLTVCEGETVTLTASAGYAGYSWSTGATTQRVTVSESGTYTVTGNNGCESDASQPVIVTINPRPAKPTGAQAPVANGPLTFCAGETVTLTAPAGYGAYQWSTGETQQSITTGAGGNYTVAVSDGCWSAPSDDVTVTAYPLPPSPTSIEMPAHDRLHAIGSSAAYEWTLNDNVLEGANTAQIDVNQSGLYKVRGISDEGCRSSGFASLQYTITDAEAAVENVLKIYPNPASSVIYLQAAADLHGTSAITLTDAMGRPMLHQTITLSHVPTPIQIDHIPAGLYVLMASHDNMVILKKITIQ